MRKLALCAVLLAALIPAAPASAAVFSWGHNFSGELGLGFTSPLNVVSPEPVQLPANVKEVVGASAFGAALLSDGTVQAWGSNWSGALGLGTTLPQPMAQPTTIPGLTHVKQVAIAGMHGMALLENGTVETWGYDYFGQLGTGVSARGREGFIHPAYSPVLVPGLTNVQAISAGGANDAAILRDGTVRAWGEGPALCAGRQLFESAVPITVPIQHVKAMALGGEATLGGHVLFLMDDGTVQACGDNQYGQGGLGKLTPTLLRPVPVPGLSGITQVAAGPWHSLARRSDGTAFAWGADHERQVGAAPTSQVCGRGRIWPCVMRPTAVLPGASQVAAGYASFALAGGRVFGWGGNRHNSLGALPQLQPTPAAIPGVQKVTSLHVGVSFGFAVVNQETTPAPAVDLLSNAPGALTVIWRSPPQTAIWKVQIRPMTKPQLPWGPIIALPAAARSFTFTGLIPARLYEVLLTNMASGVRSMAGVPGGTLTVARNATAPSQASLPSMASGTRSVAGVPQATMSVARDATAPSRPHRESGSVVGQSRPDVPGSVRVVHPARP
jgi:alpha-tubulin suppressor-like RCC1 family protein